MKRIAVLILLLAASAFGQSFYRLSQPFPNTTMNVCPVPSGGNPCPSPVNIYQDQGLTQLISQPVNIGATGNFGFWVSTTVSQFTVQIHAPYNTEFIVGGGGGGGAPQQALPSFPLINQGTGVAPVYAAGVTYHTTAQNWSESQTATLTGGVASSLTLAAGHAGIDVANVYGYQVYLSDGANSEAVAVTGGTYTFAGGGTILFTPFFSHGPSAYTVGSASSGIQETINSSCGNTGSFAYLDNFCNVTVPSIGPGVPNPAYNTYNVQGTIYAHLNQSVLSGYGVSLNCTGRGPCIQLGDRTNANDFTNITLQGFSFRSPTNFSSVPAYAGVQITSTVRTTNVVTINTATAHGFRPGDVITIMFTDNSAYWGDSVVATVPTNTSFTYARTGADILTQNTPGVVALAYVAVLDNANNSHLTDLTYDLLGEVGHFNHFFDLYDDENVTIEHFNNNGISLNANANWTGSFIFSSGNQAGQNAPVITMRDSTITANSSNCLTVYNANVWSLDNNVCQASGLWQAYSSNTKGNFNGGGINTIYTESTVGTNPFGSMTGAVTSGVFQTGEKWVQAVTGAVLYALNAPTGSQSASVTAVVGTPDNSHTWTGQTSLAVYTPTAVPTGYKTPFPGTGIAGLIAGTSAGAASFGMEGHGTGLSGAFQTGGAGATKYTYWIVANDTTAGKSTSPMRVLDWSSTGTDLIPVQWPRVSNGTDVITYDVIRMTTPVNIGDSFPYTGGCGGGTGGTCGSVATAISQATACGGTLVCSYQDIGSSTTSSYAITAGTYAGNLLFWPGAIVSVGSTISVDNEQSPVVGVGLNNTAIQSVKRCGGGVTAAGGANSACLTASGSATPAATLLTDFATSTGTPNLKGRQIFSQSNLYSHELITLVDNNPFQTHATIGYRPAWDVNDTFIGVTTASSGTTNMALAKLTFGAPVSIENYIANHGDGSAWIEQLTSALKSFKVPINTNSYLDMQEIANPGNPAASTCRRYVDSTTHLVTYLNSAGGTCFGGTVTASGPPVAGQGAFWTTASNLSGTTDFLVNTTGTHTMTVPAGTTSQTGLIFSGNNNSGLIGVSGVVGLMAPNNVASNPQFQLFRWSGAAYVFTTALAPTSTAVALNAAETGQNVTLTGKSSSTGNTANVVLTGASAQTASASNTQANVWSEGNFAPTSGAVPYWANFLNPLINQTSTASGTIRALAVYPFNQSLLGTEYLIAAGTASAQSLVTNTLTDKFTVDSSGNVVAQGSVTATTSVKGATYLTATNCTATGTAANPSVVSCSAAPAGAFSCDVAASAGTCTVNTTAVTANSEIAVHLNSYTGARLGVTCNTAPTAVPAIYVSAISAGTSFTINMPTITVNPACFDFTIVN